MITRRQRITALILIGSALAAASAAAQGTQGTQASQRPKAAIPLPRESGETPNAQQTRFMIQGLLRQYPPFLAEVIRLDPSLLQNEQFLAPYPNLAAFINQHPEVLRSPGFFLGDPNFDRANTFERTLGQRWDDILAGTALFAAFIILITVVTWIIKTAIDHRRWLRVSKIQSEVHSKLLDRFTQSQDLLAYIETPAGRRFLESAPILVDGPRSLSAPVGRILFSVQIGIVLALAGIGLQYVSREIVVEVAQPLFVLGILSLAVGVGFILSAFIAYALSQRLGLLNQTTAGSATGGTGASPPHA